MKKIQLLLMLWTLCLSLSAHTDATNADTYTLTIEVVPEYAASVEKTPVQVAAGTKKYVYAAGGDGYRFICWKRGDEVVSLEPYFYYTMPAEDVTLTAWFEFDPNGPGDPEVPNLPARHSLKVKASPEYAGTATIQYKYDDEFRTGYTYTPYASAKEGYRFLYWKENGREVSQQYIFTYTMPDKDVELTAFFKYDPASPGNPGGNSFDEETGLLIMDDFAPGKLYDAIKAKVSDRSKVLKVIVKGIIGNNDASACNQCSNAATVDFTRVSEFKRVQSYAFQYMKSLTDVLLPATVEEVGDNAFINCTSLSEVTLHAVIPPTVSPIAFTGVNTSGVTLYVPGTSIPFYEKADVWKDFIIRPVEDNAAILKVLLPAEANDGRYKDAAIQVVNVQNGQTLHYVVTNRMEYTFPVLTNCTYNVSLTGTGKAELGRWMGIDVKESDVSLTLTDAKVPQDFVLTIEEADGKTTQQCNVTWTDDNGSYIGSGQQLSGVVPGQQLTAHITLGEQLATRYQTPADQTYIVAEAGNSERLTLTPFEQQTVSGSVTDGRYGMALVGATVAVTQTLNGQTKVTTAITDAKGAFLMEVAKAAGELTVSQDGYMTHQQPLADSPCQVRLKAITGPVITLTTNYTTNGLNATDRKTSLFDDIDDLVISIEGHESSVQYPLLIVTDGAQSGDVLTLKVSSRSEQFLPVTTQVTLDADSHAAATIDILELGDAFIIIPTPKKSVTALLYDSSGQLVRTATFPRDSRLQLKHLKDGNYTVVAMTTSEFFGTVDALSRYAELGLTEGTDYVKANFDISSGEQQYVSLSKVPSFDESRFYYTGPNTSFTTNKRKIAIGNYLTLKANIDLNDDIRDKASNLQLVIPLPEGTDMVQNTVIRGNKTANYTIENQTLIIPVDADSEPIRFCVLPTVSEKQRLTAYLQMELDGKTIMQPIGHVTYSTKETINVLSTTVTGKLYIYGLAKVGSRVDVYEDGQLIGCTTAKANGNWSINHQVTNPRNLSKYTFHAVITTPNGMVIKTPAKEVVYNQSNVLIENINMSFYNPEKKCTYEVDYNWEFQTISNKSYTFYFPDDAHGGTEFTFTARLSGGEQNLEKVESVTFHVYMSNEKFVDLDGTLDSSSGLWVAKQKFTQYNLPLCVSGTVKLKEPISTVMDERTLTDAYQLYNDLIGNLIRQKAEVDALKAQLENVPADSDEAFNSLIQQMWEVAGIQPVSDNYEFTEEELANVDAAYAALMGDEDIKQFTDDVHYQYAEISQLGSLVPGMEFTAADGLTAEQLLADGFEEQPTTGGCFYVKYTNSLMEFVDLKANIHIRVDLEQTTINTARRAGASDCAGAQEEAGQAANALQEMAQKAKGLESKLMDAVTKALDVIERRINELDRLENLYTYQLEHYNLSMTEKLAKRMKLIDVIATKIAMLGVKENFGFFKSAKFLKILGVAALLDHVTSAIGEINELAGMFCGLPECDPPCEGVSALKGKIGGMIGTAAAYYTAQIASDVAGLAGMSTGIISELASAGSASVAALPTIAAAAVEMAISWGVGELYNTAMGSKKDLVKDDISNLDCECDECKKDPESCEDDDEEDEDDDDDDGSHPKYPQVTPIIDPSGYVYEAVSSNRLEGVMAAIYYKEEREDQYGDIYEEEVMWDAEAYAQENPQFTDAQGMYQWDVPQGMWQVRFVKDGYEPMQSEWLPVPPPQLDINLPMTQLSQPEVAEVHAYTDGTIELTFDKYMQPATLTTTAIRLTKKLGGEEQLVDIDALQLPDEELCYEGGKDSYARTVVLTTKDDLSGIGEVTLTVDRTVKSYAGIAMQDTYQQTIDVEQRISQLIADSLVMLPNGSEMAVTVRALPAEAAQGRTLTVMSRSEHIVKADATAQFNEQGEATVTLRACQPGMSAVEYGIQDGTAKASTLADVFVRGNGKMTIGLEQGWNWVSHWLYSPITPQGGYIDQILSQQGSVSQLGSMTASKVKAAKSMLLRAEGPLLEENEKSVMLEEGWNWVAWPYQRSARLSTAIAQAEEGDVISSQTAFATYEGGLWSGSLTLLRPGRGYLYKSVSRKPLHYITPSERITIVEQTEPDGPWPLDVRRYADVMNVVACLYDGNVPTEGYTVGVFDADGICRGISQSIGQRIFLNIYGDGNETLYLRAAKDDGTQYNVLETLDFTSDILGTRTIPLVLHIGETTGVGVHPLADTSRASIHNVAGQRLQSPKKGVNIVSDSNGQMRKVMIK